MVITLTLISQATLGSQISHVCFGKLLLVMRGPLVMECTPLVKLLTIAGHLLSLRDGDAVQTADIYLLVLYGDIDSKGRMLPEAGVRLPAG